MRTPCLRCLRPLATCYCAHLPRLETRTRLVFLQHPRERRVAIGTARMAHLSLPQSELHVGVDFSSHPRVLELAARPERVAVLFPGEGARPLEEVRHSPPEVLVVVDGTWPLARKVIKTNPLLAALPRVGFTPRRPGNYRIRSEPAEHCVSTIEAVVEVLQSLEEEPERFEALLRPFDFMVDTQLECHARRTGPPRRKLYRSPWQPPLELRSLAAQYEHLVLLYAEANAHPAQLGLPSELVHLVAVRPSTGERFQAVLAPRQPLAHSTPLHVELPEHVLRAGEPREQALARFKDFMRPGEKLGMWTMFAAELLAQEGLVPAPVVNVRLACTRALQERAGGVEQGAALLGATVAEPWAPGRAGRRIAALEAVVRELVARGQAHQPPRERPAA